MWNKMDENNELYKEDIFDLKIKLIKIHDNYKFFQIHQEKLII